MSNDMNESGGAPNRSLPKLVSTEQQQKNESVAAAAGMLQARKLAKARGEEVPRSSPRPAASQPTQDEIDPNAQAIIEDYAFARPKPVPSPAAPKKLTMRQLMELSKPGAGDRVESDWNPQEVTKTKQLAKAPISGASLAAMALKSKKMV